MLKKLAALVAGAALILMATGSAFATFIGDNGYEDSLQDILNKITVSPNPGVSSVDASGTLNDALLYDKYWKLTAAGGSVNTFIMEITANKDQNAFGIFDGNGSMVEIFSGANTTSDQATVTIMVDGSVKINQVDTGIDFVGAHFGYYLNTGYNIWFSDSLLNADQSDHMVAFRGTNTDTIQITGYYPGLWTNNEYVLGFEDAEGLGDQDYQDLVVLVESVEPVPEPGTMLLVGVGMLGLAIFGKRRMGREV